MSNSCHGANAWTNYSAKSYLNMFWLGAIVHVEEGPQHVTDYIASPVQDTVDLIL